MERITQKLRKLKKVVRYPYKPRSKENCIWREVEKKEAKEYLEKGLYSLKEYKRKIKEINQRYEHFRKNKKPL